MMTSEFSKLTQRQREQLFTTRPPVSKMAGKS